MESLVAVFNLSLYEPDPRTKDYPLTDSIAPILTITLAYLLTLPTLTYVMRRRPALQFNTLLIVYNCVLMICNGYIVLGAAKIYIKNRLNFFTADLPREPFTADDLKLADFVWICYMTKIVDIFDSVFFVLRKKNDHLTVLHVYHHSSMMINSYFNTRFAPGGLAMIQILINSTVHVIMYGYYGLAACGPAVQKYLWWKKYITRIQLIQFVVIITSTFYLMTLGDSYNYPRWMLKLVAAYQTSYLILFINFYIQAYGMKKKKTHQNGASHVRAVNGKHL